MLVGELIQRVQSLYSKGVQSDDTRLSPRHIYNKLLTVRTQLISEKSKNKQFINEWNYTVLQCVELIKVDPHECPCLPPVGCSVYRSKYELPKPIADYIGHLVKWVTNITGQVMINASTREEMIRVKGNKYTANSLRYVIENNYIYVYGKNIPKIIKIKMLAEDPIDADLYVSYCEEKDQDCDDCADCKSAFDVEFPIDADMIDKLIQFSLQELLEIFRSGREDVRNNSRDNELNESK